MSKELKCASVASQCLGSVCAGPYRFAATILFLAVSGLLQLALERSASAANTQACLSSGDEKVINNHFAAGNSEAILCPGAVFRLKNPVKFRAGSVMYTQGLPTGNTRATLLVNSPNLTLAVDANGVNNIELRNVIINGGAKRLGQDTSSGPTELMRFGGDAVNYQVLDHVLVTEPRGWTGIVVFAGISSPCNNVQLTNNVFRNLGKPYDVVETNPQTYRWADGISFACANGLVQNNTIINATDVGIALFGAPGSKIANNTIWATSRNLIGGIVMIDPYPYSGQFNYNGTVVESNFIQTSGTAKIKVGIAMGPRTWTCSSAKVYGGKVLNNSLFGTVGYGFAIDGVQSWTFQGNQDSAQRFGTPRATCGAVPSAPAGYQVNTGTSSGSFQSGYSTASLPGIFGLR